MKRYLLPGLLVLVASIGAAIGSTRAGECVRTYTNDAYGFAVDVPCEWATMDETKEFVAWLTPAAQEAVERNPELTHSAGVGAKFAIGVLDNPENLSVADWIATYGGDERAELLEQIRLSLAGKSVEQYRYGNAKEANEGQHTNLYVARDKHIVALAAFSFEPDANAADAALYQLAESLR